MIKITILFETILRFINEIRLFFFPTFIFILGMVLMFILAMYYLLIGHTEDIKTDISLEKLSALWINEPVVPESVRKRIMEEIKTELGLKDTGLKIAQEEQVKAEVVQPEKVLVIKNKRLYEFYQKIKDFLSNNEFNDPIVKLIKIIDKKGGCPSVASSIGIDSNKEYSNIKTINNMTQYDIYKSITLRDHTIDVCEEALKQVNNLKEGIRSYLPVVMIACLAHDIGKVPSLSEKYATGDHPIISKGVLKEIGLTEDNITLDIYAAVGNHHSFSKSDNTIDKILRSSDKLAREHELTLYIKNHNSEFATTIDNIIGIDREDVNAKTEQESSDKAEETVSPDNKTIPTNINPVPITNKEPIMSDNSIDLSEWFSLEEYICELKKYINTYNDEYNKLGSIGLSNGSIYFSAYTIGVTLSNYMTGKGKVIPDKNSPVFKGSLVYIVDKLRENDMLFEKINHPYYTNSVYIINKQSGSKGGSGILLKSEKLGGMPSDYLPDSKDAYLNNIKSVIVSKQKK